VGLTETANGGKVGGPLSPAWYRLTRLAFSWRENSTRKACDLLSKPGYRRYLRELESGGLKIDRGAVRRVERLDGKYVLMTNDLDTPAEELVLGYRDMWRAERAFRSMRTALNIEPVHHRTPVHITSHAHLCVLAYLLVRVAENRTGQTWQRLREQLERVSLSRVQMKRATVYRRKQLTGPAKNLWNRCRLDLPPPIRSGSSSHKAPRRFGPISARCTRRFALNL